jgi:Lipocalin-like domain
MQALKGLIGAWRLVSFQVRGPADAIRYPFGPDATGLLIYTANGLMAGQVMRRGRVAFAAATITGGTSDELAEAATGYIAYAGTYSVDEATSVVTHHVTMSLFPNLIGTDQRRGVMLDGDRLELSAGENGRVMVLEWERATDLVGR